ncbi:AraC-like DNA-binding protein [Mucilaginibacter frigoritolerans]|uniref:AraC-like DNA-binding protein n=1 Tax=Mucilaginibacter frigoritolerans TaxID=652788 RepID=A0A562UH67_9SPHI|nr:helix-turn-helix transcriptional regulator [Mucilaginibacter frigoritolerans]TWJ04969.1 AraC-like DNA-binding protein [Mucilaginibacter frigoritolerans]
MITNIKKYSFKEGLPQEFEIVELAGFYEGFKKIITAAHRASFYHIIWFQKGNPTHSVDFIPINIKPNTILFLNKDTIHHFDSKNPFDGRAILFTDSFFCKTDADHKFLRDTILFNNLFPVSQIKVGHQESLFESVFQLMTNELLNAKDSSQDEILQNLLHNLLLISERGRRKQNITELKKGLDLDYVMLFKDALDANYKSKKQVSFYAEKILITEKRLNQATTKLLSKTPKEFIDDRVMLEAKRLLAHTAETIKAIGFDLGFDEPTNFIKYFRKHSHSTPAEFRKKNNQD